MVSSDTTKLNSNTFSRKNEMPTSLKRSYYKHSRQRAARNTWSASTRIAEIQDESFFLLPEMTIKQRIASYERRYETCMESRTQLSSWIKSNKAKGIPVPLMEDYRPPPRSRLSEFLTTSLSSKNKRHSYRSCPNEPITVKSSLSTFLRKATNYSLRPSSSSSTNNTEKCRQKVSVAPSKSSTNRFSLASSLNRFSLNKNNKPPVESKSKKITREQSKINNNGKLHAGSCKDETPVQPKRILRNQPRKSPQLADIIPSLSIRSSKVDVELKSIPEEINLQKRTKNRLSIPPILESPTLSPNERSRPQSIIIPETTSSVFLDRFLSRVPCQDYIDEKQKFLILQPSLSPKPNYVQSQRPMTSFSTTLLPHPKDFKNKTEEQWSMFLSKTHGPSSNFSNRNTSLTISDVKKKRLSLLINPTLSMRLSPQKSNLKRQSMLA